MERGSSVVECRTRNQVTQVQIPLCYRFEDWAFSFSPLMVHSASCINEYLAIDSGGNVSDLALARNCCLATGYFLGACPASLAHKISY